MYLRVSDTKVGMWKSGMEWNGNLESQSELTGFSGNQENHKGFKGILIFLLIFLTVFPTKFSIDLNQISPI